MATKNIPFKDVPRGTEFIHCGTKCIRFDDDFHKVMWPRVECNAVSERGRLLSLGDTETVQIETKVLTFDDLSVGTRFIIPSVDMYTQYIKCQWKYLGTSCAVNLTNGQLFMPNPHSECRPV